VCIETIILFIPAPGYLLFPEASVDGHFSSSGISTGLFLGTGLAISALLLLFGVAAHRLRFPPLVYVNTLLLPIALLPGIFLYNEDFSSERRLGFILIWLGLLLYAGENLYIRYRRKCLQLS